MNNDVTAIAWELAKADGTDLLLHRIVVVHHFVIVGTAAPRTDRMPYHVRDWATPAGAITAALYDTEACEGRGYTLYRYPRVRVIPEEGHSTRAWLTTMVGHHSWNPNLEATFLRTMREGRLLDARLGNAPS